MPKKLYNLLLDNKIQANKSFAILIDPDKATESHLGDVVRLSELYGVDYFFVGGSLITLQNFENTLTYLKKKSSIPVIIFPGSNLHIVEQADGLLLLSLISGRNSDFLIGQHVVAAPKLKSSHLEILPTGYLLIDGGRITTVSYISNTTPIPNDKPEIAAATALAGEMLGLKLIYLDSGSGAMNAVSAATISLVSNWVKCPIIVGGGIKSAQNATDAWKAGADVIVIGNAIEKDIDLIEKICKLKNKYPNSIR